MLHHNGLTGKLDCCVLSWQLIAASCHGSGEQRAVWKRWSVDWRSCPPSFNGTCFTWVVASVYSAASFSHTCPWGAQRAITPAHLWFGKSRTKWTERVKQQGRVCTNKVVQAILHCWREELGDVLNLVIVMIPVLQLFYHMLYTWWEQLHVWGHLIWALNLFTQAQYTFLTRRWGWAGVGWGVGLGSKCIMWVSESEHVLI